MRYGKGLEEELFRLTARLNKASGGGYVQAKIARAWGQVAGDLVKGHTVGAHLKAGTLIVYVDSPVWATELSALSEGYRTALNTEIGEELVKTVRFSVSRKVDESFRRALLEELEQKEHKRADVSVELTPQERAEIEEAASVVADGELRDAVIRAQVADLEWKKGLKAIKEREAASGGV